MMSRSGSRRLWFLVFAGFLGAAFFMFKQAQEYQTNISRAERQHTALRIELQQGSAISAALADLDNFTIDEKNATTLDILRHLSLEGSSMQYQTRSRTTRSVGGTQLYTRTFALGGVMSYQEALAQADFLHNTNKVVLNRITLTPGEGFGNIVNLDIEGTLYGLDK